MVNWPIMLVLDSLLTYLKYKFVIQPDTTIQFVLNSHKDFLFLAGLIWHPVGESKPKIKDLELFFLLKPSINREISLIIYISNL